MLTVRVIEEFLQVCWNQLGASQAAGRAWRGGGGAWRGGEGAWRGGEGAWRGGGGAWRGGEGRGGEVEAASDERQNAGTPDLLSN